VKAIQRILFPTDFSDNSRAAIDYVEAFAKAYDAQVHLLHVIHALITSVDYNFGPVDPSELELQRKQAVEQALENLQADLDLDPGRIVRAVEMGDVHGRIRAYVIEHGIDLIILATRGLGGLHHLLLGSTAERVVRTAPCPVLTVKATA
jgi:universal stress protein A